MEESGQIYFAPEDEISDADAKRLALAEALEDLKRISARMRALEILRERTEQP